MDKFQNIIGNEVFDFSELKIVRKLESFWSASGSSSFLNISYFTDLKVQISEEETA